MKKLICIPTQRYAVLSGRIGRRFAGTLTVEINGIWNWHWNAERVIVFQTVILQRVRLVSVAINIRNQIPSLIDLWNRGAYDELVQDSYIEAVYVLGNNYGTQTQEKHHSTFSNLAMCRKLREDILFICERKTGEFFYPTN